jgi:hypothetical protein
MSKLNFIPEEPSNIKHSMLELTMEEQKVSPKPSNRKNPEKKLHSM